MHADCKITTICTLDGNRLYNRTYSHQAPRNSSPSHVSLWWPSCFVTSLQLLFSGINCHKGDMWWPFVRKQTFHSTLLAYMRYIKNRAQTRSLAPLTFLMKTKSEIRKGAKKTTECPKKYAPIKQKWPNTAGLSTFQSGPKGSKRVRNGNPRCYWQFGPIWTLLDHFRQKSICCPMRTQ